MRKDPILKTHVLVEEEIRDYGSGDVDSWISFFQGIKENPRYANWESITIYLTGYEEPAYFLLSGYRPMTEKELEKEKARIAKDKENARKSKDTMMAQKIIKEQGEKALYEKLKEKYEKGTESSGAR